MLLFYYYYYYYIHCENTDELNIFEEYFYYVMNNAHLPFPSDAGEALDLFQKLIGYASPSCT